MEEYELINDQVFTGANNSANQERIWKMAKRFNRNQQRKLGKGRHGVINRHKCSEYHVVVG